MPKSPEQDGYPISPSQEREFSPEHIQGSPYRVPYIMGEGSGNGFRLENFTLPIGWENASDQLKKLDHKLYERSFYSGLRHRRSFSIETSNSEVLPGSIEIDNETGLLISLSSVNPEVQVKLNQMGTYIGRQIPDLETAFVFQNELVSFLNRVNAIRGSDDFYPNIVRSGRGYGSENLNIPTEIEYSNEIVMTDLQQLKVRDKAKNIAGRFGKDIKYMTFDERGLLKHVTLDEGSACEYYLGSTMGGTGYMAHNVDHFSQAATLHAICGIYINTLLDLNTREEH